MAIFALFQMAFLVLLFHIPAGMAHANWIHTESTWKWVVISGLSKAIGMLVFWVIFLFNRVNFLERPSTFKYFLFAGAFVFLTEIVARKWIFPSAVVFARNIQSGELIISFAWPLFWGVITGILFGYAAFLRFQFP